MLDHRIVKVVSDSKPRPTLLSTVEPDLLLTPGAAASASPTPIGTSIAKRLSRIRQIMFGILGAAFLAAVAIVAVERYAKGAPPRREIKLVETATHSVVKPKTAEPPAPITAQISADMLRVTAISLGHPKLAIINGRAVSEGDVVQIHAPAPNVEITLRVLKISDGQIEFYDGTQVFAVRLSVPSKP